MYLKSNSISKCHCRPQKLLRAPLIRERFIRRKLFILHQWKHVFLVVTTLCCILTLVMPPVGSFTACCQHNRACTSRRNDTTCKQLFGRKLSNTNVLQGLTNQNNDEMIQSLAPVASPTTSQYVQQEQLLEVVSRIGADTIASLSISERTKRAMLAEAVEDEIFACTEQIIDLVKEQQEQTDITGESDRSANDKRNNEINEKLNELKERSQSLQSQYNDLVSGRSSSLLNTVNSFGGPANAYDAANEENSIDDGHDTNASYNQFS